MPGRCLEGRAGTELRMSKLSAGLLLYRHRGGTVEVFLVHPGGPFWRTKDAGAWSVPKGECIQGENPQAAARREFEEETGFPPSGGAAFPLGEARLPSGKVIVAWAVEGDCEAEAIRSNTFPLEWPPKSGTVQEFPEVDRAAWFSLEDARERLHPAQRGFLDRLALLQK